MTRIWTDPVNRRLLIISILVLVLPGILVALGLPEALRVYREWHLYLYRWHYIVVVTLGTLVVVNSALRYWQSKRGLTLPFILIWIYLVFDPRAKLYNLVRWMMMVLQSAIQAIRNRLTRSRMLDRERLSSPGVSHRYLLFIYAEIFALESKISTLVEQLDQPGLFQHAGPENPKNQRLQKGYKKLLKKYCRYLQLVLDHTCDQNGLLDDRWQIGVGLLALLNHCRAELITCHAFGMRLNWEYESLLESYSSMIVDAFERQGRSFLFDAQDKIDRLLMDGNKTGKAYQALGEIYNLLLAPSQPAQSEELLSDFHDARDLLTFEGTWTALLISQTRLLCEWLVRSSATGNGCEEMVSLYQSFERDLPLAIEHPRIAYACGYSWRQISAAIVLPQNEGNTPNLPPKNDNQDATRPLKQAAKTFAQVQADSALVKAGASHGLSIGLETRNKSK